MTQFAIIGCGFVADLYMRSFATFPEAQIAGVYDRDTARLEQFCSYWSAPPCGSLDTALASLPEGSIVLNLTNPASHAEITRAALDAGHHVYSEKPMAMDMTIASALADHANSLGLHLASAPCSSLGHAAQSLAKAVRDDVAGTIRLIYAELDDGFITQAPYRDWKSESGAPWPFEDEFRVGCTLEHAGYYLSWLVAMFGSVRRVVSAASETLPGKPGASGTADFSVATLEFVDGPPVRLTCSITASHDHQIRLFGDKGVLSVKQAWANSAKVKFHRRFTLRRRLMEHPIGRSVAIKGETHPKVKRWGAAEMNFALGPMEMASAIANGRTPRLAGDFALHLNEVTLAMQTTGIHEMTTRCKQLEPMSWAM